MFDRAMWKLHRRDVLAILVGMLAWGASLGLKAGEPVKPEKLYDLRTYHAMDGKLEPLLARFREHTLKLFGKHGMTHVGSWLPVGNADRRFICLLAYPDRASRDASWQAFSDDEAWKSVVAASEAGGKLVAKVDQVYLTETDFSPGFAATDNPGTHLFEMRTYTVTAGNLPALHKRFRDHTLRLFSRHGMSHLGYFRLVPGQAGADETLIYFLTHADAEKAAASWSAFRSDPEWLAAKKASEEAAGSSLTIPDGVKSLFLKPADFSPIQ